jgi:hypothetical protein
VTCSTNGQPTPLRSPAAFTMRPVAGFPPELFSYTCRSRAVRRAPKTRTVQPRP